jgi:thiol:disulfide interchange protein DsbG
MLLPCRLRFVGAALAFGKRAESAEIFSGVKNMRRALALLTVSIAALMALGCEKPPIERNEKSEKSEKSENSSAPPASPAQSGVPDAAKLDSLKGFIAGGGSMMIVPTAYVLFDPQCPHCGELWAQAKPLIGQVKVKWIPVGLLNAKSKTQSGMLLEARDPTVLMSRYEDEMRSSGASLALDGTPAQASLEEVDRNTQALKQSGAKSVPTIFYRNSQTPGQLSMMSGVFPTASLATMFGVRPAQN